MDSPPPEEYLAGFWIMEAADLDVALKLAADLDVALKLAAEGSKACSLARNQALGAVDIQAGRRGVGSTCDGQGFG